MQVVSHGRNGDGAFEVVITGTHAELSSSACADEAARIADQNIRRPGFNGIPSPLPVNAAGETTDDVIYGREPIACYKITFVFNEGL